MFAAACGRGKEEEGRGERGDRWERGRGKRRKREEKERERDRERGRRGEERVGKERKRKKEREGREGEEGRREWEKRNVVHSTNRGVCLRATDLTIFWLVSGVASGRKASDGLTRVEQIYRKNKHKKKKTADSNNYNFAAHQYMCTYTKRQVRV